MGKSSRNKVSWTRRCDDGVKREVRVEIQKGRMKWQFKRHDEERWDYDSAPTTEDWDALEEILERQEGRGRGASRHEIVKKWRRLAGA